MSDTLDALLHAVGAAPALPGARCRGRHHLFDDAHPNEDPETVAQRRQQALALCRGCPALASCSAWVDGLPPRQRPPGVVAGRLNAHTPRGRHPTEDDHRPRRHRHRSLPADFFPTPSVAVESGLGAL